MAPQSVVQLARLGIPHFASLVKRACDHLIAIRVVERDGVDDVFVALERQQLLPSVGVPNFAGAIVGASDETIARLVKGAIGERQNVCPQDLRRQYTDMDISSKCLGRQRAHRVGGRVHSGSTSHT